LDKATVAKRLVIHLSGYDPVTSHAGARNRFVRELRRFEPTWSARASTGPMHEGPDGTEWRVIIDGPNWHVETDFHLVRWDDLILKFSSRSIWYRIAVGVIAFLDFVIAGALWGYLRSDWRYAVFFLYPFVTFGALFAITCFVGLYAWHASTTMPAILAIGFVLAGFVISCWRWLNLGLLFDDWIFSRAYIRWGDPIIEQRLDKIAHELVEVARESDVDEILVIGHSLGAVVAIDLLDRALKLDPSFGEKKIPVTFLSIGSSILKIGLHGGAERFRAAVDRVARSPGIFWGEYQARIDIMNFYKTNPMAEMSLSTENGPVVKLVEFSQMLERVMYRSIRLKFYRVHCQFVSGNDKRYLYDYFMLVCGPISAKCQTMAPEGALLFIGDDGVLKSGHACSGSSNEPARPAIL
jgi:pimeloyl-ACP methyl ester carboxylesterase